MDRDGHNDAVFFVGPEVEHTKAFSMKTLFVVKAKNERLTFWKTIKLKSSLKSN